MADLPRPQSTAVSEVRPIVKMSLPRASWWDDIADVAGTIADDLGKDRIAAEAQHVAELQNSVESQGIEFRKNFENNPTGFQKEWGNFSAQLLGQTESRYHDDLIKKLEKEGGKNFNALITERHQRDKRLAADSIEARQEKLETRLAALSRSGDSANPEYLETMAELNANIRSQINLGLRSAESAQNDMDRIADLNKANAIVATATTLYNQGNYEAIATIHDDLVSGKIGSEIPEEKRRTIATDMMQDLTRSAKFTQAQEESGNAAARSEFVAQREKSGKDMLDLINTQQLTYEWLEKNQSILSKTDYNAGVNFVKGFSPKNSDPFVLAEIDNKLAVDPAGAVSHGRDSFSKGELSAEDLQNIESAAGDVSKKPIDETERSRIRIRQSLQIPEYLTSFTQDAPRLKSEAVNMFNAWAAKNPDATDDEIEKKSDMIIEKYRVDAAKVLPAPYGMPKKGTTIQSIGQSAQRLEADFLAGRINEKQFEKELKSLDAWGQYLGDQTDGK
jgi:hypothetical protein